MESCLCNDSLTVITLSYFTLSCYKLFWSQVSLHCIIILLELSLVKQSHNNNIIMITRIQYNVFISVHYNTHIDIAGV